MWTDGSLMPGIGIGAAYHDERVGGATYINVHGREDINVAELTATLQALQDNLRNGRTLQTFTDSLVSLHKLRGWVFGRTGLIHDGTENILCGVGEAIAERTAATELYKVRGHVGLVGNEIADTAAKAVARKEVPRLQLKSPEVPLSPWERRGECKTLKVLGEPISKIKPQLRDRVTNWLAGKRQYGFVVADMWEGHGSDRLDEKASNQALWGWKGKRAGVRVENTLKARFLELRLNGARKGSKEEKRGETCSLCREHVTQGSWFHMLSMCGHRDLRDFYTVRHHAVGRTLLSHIRTGKLGRWLVLTSFGRMDGQQEQRTIPEWVLSRDELNKVRASEPIQVDGIGPIASGISPDILILEGWPETIDPPTKPMKTWTSASGQRRRLKLILGEHACTSDLFPEHTATRKHTKYRNLIRALHEAGWNVEPTLQVVTAGVRGTVPRSNAAALAGLGITGKAQQEAQTAMAREAIVHLNRIVSQYRKLARVTRGGEGRGSGRTEDLRDQRKGIG